MSNPMNSGSDPTTNLDIQDHGSDVRRITRFVCEIDGCNRTPKFSMFGYIHFTFDGVSYSRDRLKLCKAHKTVLNQSVVTDGEQ